MFTRKDLTKLLLPLIVEQLLAVLVGMADVVMVAAVGETAGSGVSSGAGVSPAGAAYTVQIQSCPNPKFAFVSRS